MSKAFTIAGLVLAVAGALVLAWQGLRAKPFTQGQLSGGYPPVRRTAGLGFGLLALGSTLQIVGVASS